MHSTHSRNRAIFKLSAVIKCIAGSFCLFVCLFVAFVVLLDIILVPVKLGVVWNRSHTQPGC